MEPSVGGEIHLYLKPSKDQAVEELLHFQQRPQAKRDGDAEFALYIIAAAALNFFAISLRARAKTISDFETPAFVRVYPWLRIWLGTEC